MNEQPSYDGLWRKRLDALSRVWPRFLSGETEALHKTRVASRRIREALPIVTAKADPERVRKLRRKVRALTRYLGPIRELDVELGMLDTRAADEEMSRAAIALVRRDVAVRRQALRSRLKTDKTVLDFKKLLKKLERVAHAGDAPGSAQRAALAATLVRRAKVLKKALDLAGPLYVPERIHGIRISAKKLRYALEMALETGHAGAGPLLKVLKREQDRLGRLHDLESLLKHVRAVESLPRVGSLLAELNAYADTLERDCRRLHAEFVAERGTLFDAVNDVRREIVPALTIRHVRLARASRVPKSVHANVPKRA
jgi:CHAD domain-containing protein